jgi:hypothetical protein
VSDACCGTDACDAHAGDAQARGNRRADVLRVVASGLLILAGAAASSAGQHVMALAGYLGAIALSVPTPAERAWRSLRARSTSTSS